MKVLIVCSYRDFRPDGINQFIMEQVNAISACGAVCEYYLVCGKGVVGYIREIPKLRNAVRAYNPDIIHAHYGLCGLLANIATRNIPVVTTYHGSDINQPKPRKFSLLSIRLSAWNIFVSQRTMDIVQGAERKNSSLVPCGVDLTDDQLQTRTEARKTLGWKETDKKVLFAGMFEEVKGPELAKQAIALLNDEMSRDKSFNDPLELNDVELIELKGYTREEVNRLMCAVDCLLMASKMEGSPQVIKEALACGCPIVSTDVGDVTERVAGVDGSFVVYSRNPKEMAEAIQKVFSFNGKTNGRAKIIADGMDNREIARKLLNIYERVKS